MEGRKYNETQVETIKAEQTVTKKGTQTGQKITDWIGGKTKTENEGTGFFQFNFIYIFI